MLSLVTLFAACSLQLWFAPHYLSPMMASVLLLVAAGAAGLSQWRRGRFDGRFVIAFVVATMMIRAGVEARRADLCASYQQAVLDALIRKIRAVLDRKSGYRSLGLSGGVANNRTLRGLMEVEARANGISFLAAAPQHTGDNAGMIAFAAWADPAGGASPGGLHLRIEPAAALSGNDAEVIPRVV